MTDGPNWAIGWDLTKEPEKWYGIKTENGLVTEINLNSNNLKGKIPSFSVFQNLRVLYLNSNNLSGEISGFPADLQELDLSENRLSGDPGTALSSLSHLKVLNLGHNNFTTSDFAFLQNSPDLQMLNLAGFGLKKIPEQATGLSQLNDLNLANNSITDFTALQSLKNLTELNLAGNSMTALPTSISVLKDLKILNLGNNSLTKFSPLSSLKNLEWLSLENNNLKEIPSELSAATGLFSLNLNSNEIVNFATLSQLKNLQQLYLNKNKLTQIPTETAELKQLQLLSLIGNELSGEIPQNVPEFTFIQNNKYSLQEIKNLTESGKIFTSLEYSPQRYDKAVTITAPKGAKVNLTQKLSSAENYRFSWFKHLDQNTGQNGETYHISEVKPEDYAIYTVEAYYLKSIGNSYFEISFFREPITLAEGNLSTQETSSGIDIYPNPAADFLNIRTENDKLESAAIYDLSGKLLFTEKSNRINVKYLPSAVYILVLKTTNGIRNFKFIKN